MQQLETSLLGFTLISTETTYTTPQFVNHKPHLRSNSGGLIQQMYYWSEMIRVTDYFTTRFGFHKSPNATKSDVIVKNSLNNTEKAVPIGKQYKQSYVEEATPISETPSLFFSFSVESNYDAPE